MANRIYAVTILTDPQSIRLVRARNASEARKHVWDRLTKVELATPVECFRLGKEGVEIEEVEGRDQ